MTLALLFVMGTIGETRARIWDQFTLVAPVLTFYRARASRQNTCWPVLSLQNMDTLNLYVVFV